MLVCKGNIGFDCSLLAAVGRSIAREASLAEWSPGSLASLAASLMEIVFVNLHSHFEALANNVLLRIVVCISIHHHIIVFFVVDALCDVLRMGPYTCIILI